MSSLRPIFQAESPLFQLPGEVRNMIYEDLAPTTVCATFEDQNLHPISEKYVPHKISLLVRVPPTGVITACQQLHYEVREYHALVDKFPLEPPRILIQCGHAESHNAYQDSFEATHWLMKWGFTDLVEVGWAYAIELHEASEVGAPMPTLSSSRRLFKAMQFETEGMAAMAAVFTERLAEHLLWRCGNDVEKLKAKDIGPEPLVHVAVTMFETAGEGVRARSRKFKSLADISHVQNCGGRLVLEDGMAEELANQGMMQNVDYGVVYHLVYPDVESTKGPRDVAEATDRLVIFDVTSQILNEEVVIIGRPCGLQEWRPDWGGG